MYLPMESNVTKQNPFGGSTGGPIAAREAGYWWCYEHTLENGCRPDPVRPLGTEVEGCEGPNNCFSSKFKAVFSAFMLVSVLAVHGAYQMIDAFVRKYQSTKGPERLV